MKISLIYGAKGSGKTKRIIDSANRAIGVAKGSIVYLSDKSKHSKELSHQIRFIDTLEYDVVDKLTLKGFVKGILASNNDIESVYIDGITRMAGCSLDDMADVFKELETLTERKRVGFVITVSCETLPDCLKEYAINY